MRTTPRASKCVASTRKVVLQNDLTLATSNTNISDQSGSRIELQLAARQHIPYLKLIHFRISALRTDLQQELVK